MKPTLSLRTRLVIGALLWTAGLFIVTGIVTTILMMHYPESPRVLHVFLFFRYRLPATAMCVALMILGLWQVRRGIGPLRDLRARLSAVRSGRTRRVEGGYPGEVQPLVDDLNALLDHQERAVARAQSKAGDLAHGLKTPLAVLAQEADRLCRAGHPAAARSVAHEVERMRRQIDYHLAQARAAASGVTPGARCRVADSVDGLARTLRQLHSDRGIEIAVETPNDQMVRAEREDLDEMLGNLLDNACKWARSRVTIACSSEDSFVMITVDDDGTGIDPSMRDVVLQRGVRADEAAPGSGFGLAIVRDLAELYGGSIVLSESPAGGLRAELRLPA